MINSPAEITAIVSSIGVHKSHMKRQKSMINAVLGGAFVALWWMFAINTTTWLTGVVPFGIIKLLAWLVFCIWLVLCMVAGGELYTGNALLVIAKAEWRLSRTARATNLWIVWLGNLIGSLVIVALLFFAAWHMWADSAIATNLIKTGIHKVELPWIQAMTAGILCNILVCLGVWMSYAGKTATDKIIGILFPIAAFVAWGFEHVVANMFYLPYTYLLQHIGINAWDHIITLSEIILNNYIPVSIGNFLWGAVFVGLMYRVLYGENKKK